MQRLDAVAVEDRRAEQHAHRALELRVVQGVLTVHLLLELLLAAHEVEHEQRRGRASADQKTIDERMSFICRLVSDTNYAQV